MTSPTCRSSIGSSSKNMVCFQWVGLACGPVENLTVVVPEIVVVAGVVGKGEAPVLEVEEEVGSDDEVALDDVIVDWESVVVAGVVVLWVVAVVAEELSLDADDDEEGEDEEEEEDGDEDGDGAEEEEEEEWAMGLEDQANSVSKYPTNAQHGRAVVISKTNGDRNSCSSFFVVAMLNVFKTALVEMISSSATTSTCASVSTPSRMHSMSNP